MDIKPRAEPRKRRNLRISHTFSFDFGKAKPRSASLLAPELETGIRESGIQGLLVRAASRRTAAFDLFAVVSTLIG